MKEDKNINKKINNYKKKINEIDKKNNEVYKSFFIEAEKLFKEKQVITNKKIKEKKKYEDEIFILYNKKKYQIICEKSIEKNKEKTISKNIDERIEFSKKKLEINKKLLDATHCNYFNDFKKNIENLKKTLETRNQNVSREKEILNFLIKKKENFLHKKNKKTEV